MSARGFTLIELMVGLLLSVIVLFALTTLFADNSRSRQQIDQATQQIENGRYALELLRDDLHLAGYYGSVVPWQGYLPAAATAPDVCATTVANLLFNPSPTQWPVPVFGVAVPDATPACVTGPGRKAQTDILVVRRTRTIPTPLASMDANKVYVQASGCNAEGVQHKDFARDLGSNVATFALHKKGCGVVAEVYEFQTRIYYVSDETIPTLRLLTISGGVSTNEPLVEGIEDMRLEYGLDTLNGDGFADEFRKCPLAGVGTCSTLDWANAVAVRVHLLARNVSTLGGHTDTKTYTLGEGNVVGPFNDAYKRHEYSAVVRLMNPAGRRES